MRRRVVILGGGCGGVAAAWALTQSPRLRAKYDVTLVQSGWRLGGKGATGRSPSRGHAVLEHGLHIWLGFYREAFGMLADLYGAWDGPTSGPQRSLEAAFSPIHEVDLCGGDDDPTDPWRLRFPLTAGRPWDLESKRNGTAWAELALRWARALPRTLGSFSHERRKLLVGLGTAVARGIVSEFARGDDPWTRMDNVDLRAWLAAHGASAAQADAPPVRALYDLGFAYPDGVGGPNRGAVAAGAGLKVLLRIFADYRGAPFWRLNAGMGDTVFAPAWEVLRDRGVRFRFFHHVEHLGVSGGAIDSVRLGIQARNAEGYDPLVRVGDVRAWPDRPIASRLRTIAPGDLEADCGDSLGSNTLRRGQDFDDVVLAIPAPAQHHFAAELTHHNPRYAQMLQHVRGVGTIAAQWWMARSQGQLSPDAANIITGLPGLFRTAAQLGEVINAEGWRERPAGLAYMCSVTPPELQGLPRHEAAAAVHNQMRTWANTAACAMWPGARVGGRFDEGALHVQDNGAPWSSAYARANTHDWEQYVLSLPGSTRFRLAPNESGFHNLMLAGDWTKNTINGGSVEGAVSSGIAAARGIIDRG